MYFDWINPYVWKLTKEGKRRRTPYHQMGGTLSHKEYLEHRDRNHCCCKSDPNEPILGEDIDLSGSTEDVLNRAQLYKPKKYWKISELKKKRAEECIKPWFHEWRDQYVISRKNLRKWR
tara:strand:+ start:132 stop:488 length:357 start_codon:yes stop_codon:yes gene_type:complete